MVREERKRRSFNVKPVNTVGKTDGQMKNGRMGEMWTPSSIQCVLVCVFLGGGVVFQSALSWQPLQTLFSLCGDCLSVGVDMKSSC